MSEDLEPIEKVEPPCQIYYLQSSSGKVYRCYLKYDADKVIAEKDEKIEELEEHIDELQKATDSAWSKVNVYYDELSHSNYKRCLAMARCCNRMFSSTFGKERYWQKWNRIWLELADEPTWAKFLQLIHKEAK